MNHQRLNQRERLLHLLKQLYNLSDQLKLADNNTFEIAITLENEAKKLFKVIERI